MGDLHPLRGRKGVLSRGRLHHDQVGPAGHVTVKRIGTNPRPPTNEALSTWSWRTTSTCDSASKNELVILGEILAGSSCRSGSMRIACLKASTAFSSESDAL